MLFGNQTTDTNGQVPSNIVNDTASPPAAAQFPGTAIPAASPATDVTSQPANDQLLDAALSDETTVQPAETTTGPTTAPSAPAPVDDDLLALKQQALNDLTPLVDHLEQTPEEKFRTTMMMIQSTDNQALLKEAYEAAQAIPDEKARAQALLDIINEINYFTQQQH